MKCVRRITLHGIPSRNLAGTGLARERWRTLCPDGSVPAVHKRTRGRRKKKGWGRGVRATDITCYLLVNQKQQQEKTGRGGKLAIKDGP